MSERNENFTTGQDRNDGLSDRDKKVLDFAGRTFKLRRDQENGIREEFDYSGTSFWRHVSRLIDPHNPISEQSKEYAPDVVKKYQDMISESNARRSAGGTGF